MRLWFAVALMLIAAPASAQAASAGENATTSSSPSGGESPAAGAPKPDDDPKKDGSEEKETSAESAPDDPLRFLRRQRKKLKDFGITFKLHEQSEVWGNLTGGGRRATSYNGQTNAKL